MLKLPKNSAGSPLKSEWRGRKASWTGVQRSNKMLTCRQTDSSALIGPLVVLPVSLPDSVDRCQLAHQQLENGGFTSAVFTDLPRNTTAQTVS